MQCNSLGLRPQGVPAARPPVRPVDEVLLDIPDALVSRRRSRIFNLVAALVVMASTLYNVVYAIALATS